MQIDRYTKIVLTVIAACLVWISIRDLFRSTTAMAAPIRDAREVVIVGVKDSALPVKLVAESPLPVKLVAIERGSTANGSRAESNSWQPLPVSSR